jgi:hypothetical protein
VGLTSLPRLLARCVVSRTLQPCGTDAAWQRHRRHDEEPCDPCKAARAATQAVYNQARYADPVRTAKVHADARARSRAQARLAAEYPARFAGLLVEELAREATP